MCRVLAWVESRYALRGGTIAADHRYQAHCCGPQALRAILGWHTRIRQPRRGRRKGLCTKGARAPELSSSLLGHGVGTTLVAGSLGERGEGHSASAPWRRGACAFAGDCRPGCRLIRLSRGGWGSRRVQSPSRGQTALQDVPAPHRCCSCALWRDSVHLTR